MKAICFILLAVISISVSYAKQLDLKASHFKEAKPLDSLNLESLNLNTKGNKSVGLTKRKRNSGNDSKEEIGTASTNVHCAELEEAFKKSKDLESLSKVKKIQELRSLCYL